MINIRTIRKSNLLAQIDRFGSQRAFAEQAGLAPAHVSQMVTDRRNMGDEVARRIEKNLDLSEGYMDVQHQSEGYPGYEYAGHRTKVADNDSDALHSMLLKIDRVEQALSAKTQKAILRIEQAAMRGRLTDEDWEILERLVERFDKSV
jgi:plasmid maintenance system antidote protein VapI